MGHEFRGGKLKESARASDRQARLQVREHEGCLEIECVTDLDGETVRRLLLFRDDSPMIRLRVEGRAAEGRTVTARFATGVAATKLTMDASGGTITRPLKRFYDPTFWPLQSFAHIRDDAGGQGVALCLGMPGAMSCGPDGQLEAIVLRNAVRERAYGLMPFLGLPVSGHERSVHALEYSIVFTPSGDWQDASVPLVARSVLDSPWETAGRAELRVLAESVVTTDRADIVVAAVKPASRGEGIVARLLTLNPAGSPVAISVLDRTVKAAFLCDARERDLGPLQIRANTVRLNMPGTIATVRLLT